VGRGDHDPHLPDRGQPERNPIFFTGRSYPGRERSIYPYPLIRQAERRQGGPHLPAVYLQNRWVRFAIPPRVGGRIFSARHDERLRLRLPAARDQAGPDRMARGSRGHRVEHPATTTAQSTFMTSTTGSSRTPTGRRRCGSARSSCGQPHEVARRADASSTVVARSKKVSIQRTPSPLALYFATSPSTRTPTTRCSYPPGTDFQKRILLSRTVPFQISC